MKREPRHLAADVDRLPAIGEALPALEHDTRARGHRLGKADQLLFVKRRLRESSLPSPELAFAREQPLAEDGLEAGIRAALLVALRVVLEDVLDVARIRERQHAHTDTRWSDPKAHDGAVGLVQLKQPSQDALVVEVRAKMTKQRVRGGPRRLTSLIVRRVLLVSRRYITPT